MNENENQNEAKSKSHSAAFATSILAVVLLMYIFLPMVMIIPAYIYQRVSVHGYVPYKYSGFYDVAFKPMIYLSGKCTWYHELIQWQAGAIGDLCGTCGINWGEIPEEEHP